MKQILFRLRCVRTFETVILISRDIKSGFGDQQIVEIHAFKMQWYEKKKVAPHLEEVVALKGLSLLAWMDDDKDWQVFCRNGCGSANCRVPAFCCLLSGKFRAWRRYCARVAQIALSLCAMWI